MDELMALVNRLGMITSGVLRREHVGRFGLQAEFQYYDHGQLLRQTLRGEELMKMKADLNEAKHLESMIAPMMEKLKTNDFMLRQEIHRQLRQDRRRSLAKWIASRKRSPGYNIYTMHGDFVRSKSEAMISDFLMSEGIQFCYEKPLRLLDGSIIRPDFSMELALECWWEHQGKTEEGYNRSNEWKAARMEEMGISEGERIFITREDPLDMEMVKRRFRAWVEHVAQLCSTTKKT
ncbi:MAG: hypothetical protein IJM90_02555 [Firmicutes bacterium]|nr:hypothetical protein [Bacillota bacterium]